MFSPFKNLITYFQKNATGGNSIFGSSHTSTEPKKVEKENLHSALDKPKMKEQPSQISKDEVSIKKTLKTATNSVTTKSPTSKLVSPVMPRKTIANINTNMASGKETSSLQSPSTENEDDDIETQLDTSIMLKTPVKRARTNDTEILEVKKLPQSRGRSIYISHDYNRNHTVTSPVDDELEDFRYDPTETVIAVSSSLQNKNDSYLENDDYAEVITSDEDHTEDFSTIVNATECVDVEDSFEDCEDGIECVRTTNVEVVEQLTDNEILEEDVNATASENELCCDITPTHVDLEDVEKVAKVEAEETYFELNNFPDCEVVVISENDSGESVTSSDDPLAIACEEQEAFAADRSAAFEELNLLNSSNNSQDEDTRTTADEDLQWLRVDLSVTEDNEQPSCSKSIAVKNLVSNENTPEKDERNGEGSDSGLGSETSALHITNTSLGDASQLNIMAPETAGASSQTPHSQTLRKVGENEKTLVNSHESNSNKSPLKMSPKPLRSNLKRRLEVDDEEVDGLGKLTSASSTSSIAISSSSTSTSGSVQKKPKRSINFDSVQVFYFPRQQGFGCVPSAGGCTLGMGARHVAFKTLTLAEHAAELRRAHRMQLQEINPRGSSSDDSEESEEDYLSEGSGSDLDGESNGFLQPVSPKQRRAILKAAGLRKIDTSEKAECRDIRNSREVCGCSCRDFCDPETCACSQSGIKCQVDRDMFPCGCNRDACGNTIGRVEFNPARVRTHFIHTLMRLEMENRQQQNPYSSAVVVPSSGVPNSTTAGSFYQSTHLQQPQSNYSSGYASPAYNSTIGADMHGQTSVNSSFYHQQAAINNSGSLYGIDNAETLLPHPVSAAVAAPYGIDSLDSGLFVGGGPGATPSYGELMPVASYHHNINYGNVAPQQVPAYNTYLNPSTSYMNAIADTATPTTYSSCAVPSLPPYGTATTTEATSDYHSVNSLNSLETTTAPSCTTVANTSTAETQDTDSDVTSFISLSTPLASSSRLSQINDLLQHNRNATTALVAVSQNVGVTKNLSVTSSLSGSSTLIENKDCHSNASSANSNSINTPPIEDAHKSCMVYGDFNALPPLKPAPIVVTVLEENNIGTVNMSDMPALTPKTPSADLKLYSTQTNSIALNSEETQEIVTPMIDFKTSTCASTTLSRSAPLPPSTTLNSEILSEALIQETPTSTATATTTASMEHKEFEKANATTKEAICETSNNEDKQSEEPTAPIDVAFDPAIIPVAAGN